MAACVGIGNKNILYGISVVVFLLPAAWFTTNRTNTLDIYGGGGTDWRYIYSLVLFRCGFGKIC